MQDLFDSHVAVPVFHSGDLFLDDIAGFGVHTGHVDFRNEFGESLSDVARLDTMVTVVDAANLLNDFSSHDFLRDRCEVMDEEDERSLVHLLTDHIEFADVVILNNVSDASPAQVDAAVEPGGLHVGDLGNGPLDGEAAVELESQQ